ncbi:MAG TPA: M3 family metallopeptidase, partial [Methylocystis sp.]
MAKAKAKSKPAAKSRVKAKAKSKPKAKPAAKPAKAKRENPLLARWRTPFGAPPFDKIQASDFPSAFAKTLAAHKAEIRAIAGNSAKPSFANTLVALEKSGEALSRVADVFFNLTSADTNPALQEIERDIAPKLADHASAIYLNGKLFRRIDDLNERRDRLNLDAEQARLLERMHKGFVRSGAKLGAKAKKRVAEINSRLATLSTAFAQNVLADEQSWRLVLRGEADLAGLTAPMRAAAERTAKSLGIEDGSAITLARSSVESFLQFSSRRDLREEAFKAWIKRGENGGKTDNRAIVAEIVDLRAEFAKLMGYESYAAFHLDDSMAKTPETVRDLLGQVWPAAVKKAAQEREALAALVRAEGGNFSVAAWDWRYLAEKERKARYHLDEGEVRSYLTLDNVIAAAFDTASRLFGIAFKERDDIPTYHPDVRTWEVRTKGGKHVGLFLGDYFARPSKRSGAWMSTFRGQHKLKGEVRPIVTNVMSCSKGAEGEPTLLSFDDARTLF